MRLRILSVSMLLLSYVALHAAPNKTPFKVVGYYSMREAMKPDYAKIPFEKLTHINLWFLNPDSLGNMPSDLTSLKGFIDAAHKAKVKVLFSIGGGSKQKQYHWLLQDDKRPTLVRNLIAEVMRCNMDGIDVDLEGSDINENYEKFVIELHNELSARKKLLTAAIAVYYKDQLTDKAIAQFDFVNIMSYDRTGPWRPEKPGQHSGYNHAVEDLTYFGNDRKVAKSKMTLGVPFYGHGFTTDGTNKAKSMSFSAIVSSFPGAEKTDEWKMPDGMTMYYNGIPTITQKTQLAKKNASGIMIWQLLGDAPGDISLLNAIHVASKKRP